MVADNRSLTLSPLQVLYQIYDGTEKAVHALSSRIYYYDVHAGNLQNDNFKDHYASCTNLNYESRVR